MELYAEMLANVRTTSDTVAEVTIMVLVVALLVAGSLLVVRIMRK